MINYTCASDLVEYKLPNLGSGVVHFGSHHEQLGLCLVAFSGGNVSQPETSHAFSEARSLKKMEKKLKRISANHVSITALFGSSNKLRLASCQKHFGSYPCKMLHQG